MKVSIYFSDLYPKVTPSAADIFFSLYNGLGDLVSDAEIALINQASK